MRELGTERLFLRYFQMADTEPIHRSIALAERLGFREERTIHPEDLAPIWALDNNML